MKKSSKLDEVVNPLSALGKLRSAYQTYKYGTNLPKEIEAVKQARLDTELKKAQVKLAKQGKLPGAADDATTALDVKPKGPIGKAVDVATYPFRKPVKTALGATAAATGYEYLKDPKADIGTLVGRGVKDVVDVGGKALGWAAEKGAKLAGDVVRGYTGVDTQVANKDKEKPEPQAARPSDDRVQPLPTRGIGFDELREDPVFNKVLDKYELFLNEESEQQKRDRERLQALQRGIYGQESGYGKARTDKPNYAGAIGPMQIMPGTFNDMKKAGLIPKDYDIKNPEHNRAAGNALIAHYYDKYKGDPAKVAAAYYAGPKAVNKDGTINTHYRDRKNPKAPNVGQYIDFTLGKSGIKDVNYTAAKPSAFKIPQIAAATPTAPTAINQTAVTNEPDSAFKQAVAGTAGAVAGTAGTSDVWKDVPLGGLPKMDWEAFRLAAKKGEDTEDTSRFLLPKTAALYEKYQKHKLEEAGQPIDYDRASKDYYDMREKKLGKTASQLASASQGQFATKADRLDQAKVDAALGPGYRAGSKEANLALLQKFQGQQPQQPQQGQAGRPSPTPSPAVPAVRGAENLTPYSTAADVAGLTGLAAAGGQFLPKVGGAIAKAVPGLNVAYQGADALRRASLGDTTGSAISAAGAVPVLGIPAIAAQAVRDKYRTGSFFPSDQELKTAVDQDRGVAPTPAATPAPQAATTKLKEGNKAMNKKQLKKRLEKLEETKSQMIQSLHDRAVAEGKADAVIRFGKMLRGLGGGAEALPASTIRKGGQTFDKVRGVDSELKYVNRADPKDLKSLDDIKNIGNKSPAVWRKGGGGAAGAADDVAAAAAKGGKPLSRTATALGAATGGALIGYGLGMGGDDKPGPDPTPVPPGPGPAPRPTPPKPTPVKPGKDDPWDLRPVKPSVDDTPGSEDWLRRRVNQPTVDTTKPSDKEDPSVTASRAAAAEKLADIQRAADFAKQAREKPTEKPIDTAKDNIDVKATADRDRISRMVNQTNESLDEILRLAGMSKK